MSCHVILQLVSRYCSLSTNFPFEQNKKGIARKNHPRGRCWVSPVIEIEFKKTLGPAGTARYSTLTEASGARVCCSCSAAPQLLREPCMLLSMETHTHDINVSLVYVSAKQIQKKVSDLVMKDWISKMDIHSYMRANEEQYILQTHSFGASKCSMHFKCDVWDFSSTHMHRKSTFFEKAVLDFKLKRRRWYSHLPSWDGAQLFAAYEAHNRRVCTQPVI